jgi:8-oxo-dGTP diphosphatase
VWQREAVRVEQVRVVGVALLAGPPGRRRVLAARRTRPASAAGRWELPGGKCVGAEPVEPAAVREVREELGCEVRVTGRLDGCEPVASGVTLEVVTAELVAGEPLPLEHDALRWLAADQLEEVAWLAPDVPFVERLRPLLTGAEPPS